MPNNNLLEDDDKRLISKSEFIPASEFKRQMGLIEKTGKEKSGKLIPAESVKNQLKESVFGEKTIGDYVVEIGKTTAGGVEAAIGNLLSTPVEAMSGIAGFAKALTSGERAIPETMEPIREKVGGLLPPYSEAGKKFAEKAGRGAEYVTQPFVKGYRKYIEEPAISLAEELGGPQAGVITGTLTSILPTVGETILGSKYGRKLKKKVRKGFPIKEGKLRDWYTRLTPTVTQRGAKRKAASFMVHNFRRNPIVVKNATEAARLERAIEGLKFDITGVYEDPLSIRMTEGMKRRFPKAAEDILDRLEHRNLVALKRKLESIKPSDDPTRLREALELRQGAIETFGESEKAARLREVSKMRGVNLERVSPEARAKAYAEAGAEVFTESGTKVRKTMSAAEKATRRYAGMLFERVPDDYIDMDFAVKKISEVIKPTSKAEVTRKNVPKEVYKLLDNLNKEGNAITAKELHKARSDLLREVRTMEGKREGRNRNAERRMYQVIDILDDSMRNAEFSSGQVSKEFEAARKFYFENVIKKFESPEIQKLHRNNYQRNYVADAEVPGLFFKKGKEGIEAARQFKSSIGEKSGGNRGAYEALESWIDNDLLDSVYDVDTDTLSTASLKKWLNEHKYALEEYGLSDKYNNITKIQAKIDRATVLMDEFDKSIASKILNSDVGKEIEFLRSSKTPGKDALELMKLIKDDPRAVAGVQRALVEQIEMIDPGDVKSLNKLFDQYDKLYNTIFARYPEKLQAMRDYRSAYKKLYPKDKLPTNWEDMNKVFQDFFPKTYIGNNIWTALYRSIIRIIPEIGQEKIKRIILKATLDPDFANELRQLGKTGLKPRTMERRLLKYLYTVEPAVLTKEFTTGYKEEEENE